MASPFQSPAFPNAPADQFKSPVSASSINQKTAVASALPSPVVQPIMPKLNMSGTPNPAIPPMNMTGAPTRPLTPIVTPQIDNPLTIPKAQAQTAPQSQNPISENVQPQGYKLPPATVQGWMNSGKVTPEQIHSAALAADSSYAAGVARLDAYAKAHNQPSGTDPAFIARALSTAYKAGTPIQTPTTTNTLLQAIHEQNKHVPVAQVPSTQQSQQDQSLPAWDVLGKIGNALVPLSPDHTIGQNLAHDAAQVLPIGMGILGGMSGGVMTAPTGPGALAGAVGGSALGYAAGGGAARMIDQMTGYDNNGKQTAPSIAALPSNPVGEVKQMGIDAAVGATSELVSQGLAKAATYAAGKMSGKAGRIINSLIKPVNNEFKFGKDPGQAIVDEGITGKSLEDLGTNVSTKLNDIGGKIQSTIEAVSSKKPPQIDITKTIEDAFAPAIKDAGALPRTGATQVEYLNNLKQDLIDAYGGTHTPLGVFQAKQAIQDSIKFNATDPFNGTKNEALWNAFTALKNANNEAVPGLSVLNERYSNLVGAKSSIARRVMNASRANIHGLTSTIGAGAAGAATFAETGDWKKALGAAGMGAVAPIALGSTLSKTYEAQIMNSMPEIVKGAMNSLGVPAKAALMQFLSATLPKPSQEARQ